MSSDFYDRVYAVVQQIPQGRVSTYGAIARYLGTAQSARMVGYALNGCSSTGTYIPAHRVVNRLGQLSGKRYFGGPTTMQELLACEGVRTEDNQIINFEQHFWDPAMNL